MAFPKDRDFLPTGRAFYIAHVFDYAKNGNMHHVGHGHCLGNNHGNQLLRRGNYQNAIQRNRLKHRQRHVTRSGRHIDKQKINVFPKDVRPELRDHICNNRSTPNNGVCFILQHQVHAHHINAGFAGARQHTLVLHHGTPMNTKRLRNGRTCNIGVQHTSAVTAAMQQNGHHCGNKAFANAALAADNANHFFNAAFRVWLLQKTLWFLALPAVLGAGAAVMGTFAHFNHSCFSITPACKIRMKIRCSYFGYCRGDLNSMLFTRQICKAILFLS